MITIVVVIVVIRVTLTTIIIAVIIIVVAIVIVVIITAPVVITVVYRIDRCASADRIFDAVTIRIGILQTFRGHDPEADTAGRLHVQAHVNRSRLGVAAGTAQSSSIGWANSLGIPGVANGTISIGSTTSAGTLVYTGAAQNTDRAINLAGTTGGATLDQSGTGLLKFTSAFTATGVGSKTLTLQGSTAGTGEIAGAVIDNSSTDTTSLIKAGTGTWTLSGANTYTGNTVVNDGTLAVTSSGSLSFRPTTNGLTNAVSGSATATLTFEGTVNLDLSAAVATPGNSWNLFNIASFTGPVPTVTPTAVTATLGSFTQTSPGVWTLSDGANVWTFTQATGSLTYGSGTQTLDHFAISTISSPQTVGTPITGITITALDSSNNTFTGFAGTVDFTGTAGITGTSGTFINGQLTGLSVTPLNSGTGLTLVVTATGGSATGTATFNVQTQYEAWAAGAGFTDDSNNDGVPNGLAWLLGAGSPSANATGLLPVASQEGGKLVMTFDCLNIAARGPASPVRASARRCPISATASCGG